MQSADKLKQARDIKKLLAMARQYGKQGTTFKQIFGVNMGYTHYWKKESKIKQTEYTAALQDIVKIIKSVSSQSKMAKAIEFAPIPLADGQGNEGTSPELLGPNAFGIAFNGVGEDAHETFALPASAADLEDFEFCKTNQKPYDTVVVACLARLSEVKGIIVSSDGDSYDFTKGLELAKVVLKRNVGSEFFIP